MCRSQWQTIKTEIHKIIIGKSLFLCASFVLCGIIGEKWKLKPKHRRYRLWGGVAIQMARVWVYFRRLSLGGWIQIQRYRFISSHISFSSSLETLFIFFFLIFVARMAIGKNNGKFFARLFDEWKYLVSCILDKLFETIFPLSGQVMALTFTVRCLLTFEELLTGLLLLLLVASLPWSITYVCYELAIKAFCVFYLRIN